MSSLDSLLAKLASLNVGTVNGSPAPHKPLLLLYALGQLSQGRDKLPYWAVDSALQDLLREFVAGVERHRTQYPFMRLVNDDKGNIWEICSDAPIELRPGSDDPSKKELLKKNTFGKFTDNFKEAVTESPSNFYAVVSLLLHKNFPETLHERLLNRVGLRLNNYIDSPNKRQRSAEFRKQVLGAYNSRCCVCGYDLRLGETPVGLEAAHIKWFQAGGPDKVNNGLALCTLHHKVFDLGAFTINSNDLVLIFSDKVNGSERSDWLLGFHGQPLRRPQNDKCLPDEEFLDWRKSTIFKEPGRV